MGTTGVLGLGESSHCSGQWIQVRPDRQTKVVRVLREQGLQPSATQSRVLRVPVPARAQSSPIQGKW